MSITSLGFYVFIAIVLMIYYLMPSLRQWLILLAASTIFMIAGSNWKLYLFFVFQALLAYIAVYLFRKYPKQAKLICTSAIVVQMLTLTVWKGNSFLITNANFVYQLVGSDTRLPYLEWVAPLAISYYTLMLVSYILDVYWQKIEPERNPLKLLLYAGFFPQMVSGPITRYGEVTSQLFEGHKFNYKTFCFGCQRILWGFFKKLVLAERLSIIVNTIYGGGLEGTWTPTGTYVWVAMLAYMFQLYTDFSGGIDIILGVALLFGIDLPENFDTPFYSTSVSEFWRRWHITLGAWLRDYIMYPFLKSRIGEKLRNFCKEKFGKKAAKRIPTYVATLLVWAYCGFWHGGAYKWIVWGLLTFAIIVGGMIMQPLFDKLKTLLHVDTTTWSWTFFGRLRTTLLFMITISVQPANSVREAMVMWKHAFDFNPWILVDGSLYSLGLDRIDFWIMIYGLLILLIVSIFQQKGSVRERIAQQNLLFRWQLWILLFVVVLLFGMYGEGYDAASFIYGGF